MSLLNQIWDYLHDPMSAAPDIENLDASEGKLSIEEVRQIALEVKKKEAWFLVEPRHINLCRKTETGELFWSVIYLLEDAKEDYLTGTMGIVNIDDETGEIISKGYVPH